jgi:magnesium chelatase family protein
MLAKVQSCAAIGLEGVLVEVEVEVTKGLAAFTIGEVSDAAVNDARERIRFALKTSGFHLAGEILLLSEQIISNEQIGESIFLGELFMDRRVHHTNSILSMMTLALKQQIKAVLCLPPIQGKRVWYGMSPSFSSRRLLSSSPTSMRSIRLNLPFPIHRYSI